MAGSDLNSKVKAEGTSLNNAGVIGPEFPKKGDNNIVLSFSTYGTGIGYRRNITKTLDIGVSGHSGGFVGTPAAMGIVAWQPLQKDFATNSTVGPMNISAGVMGGAAVDSIRDVTPIIGGIAEITHLNSGASLGLNVGFSPFGSTSSYNHHYTYPYNYGNHAFVGSTVNFRF